MASFCWHFPPVQFQRPHENCTDELYFGNQEAHPHFPAFLHRWQVWLLRRLNCFFSPPPTQSLVEKRKVTSHEFVTPSPLMCYLTCKSPLWLVTAPTDVTPPVACTNDAKCLIFVAKYLVNILSNGNNSKNIPSLYTWLNSSVCSDVSFVSEEKMAHLETVFLLDGTFPQITRHGHPPRLMVGTPSG